ncbi:uncharacterized protein LOC125205852 isoform X1 [Salvia hispanica]|uniref:uncharacterized protein LOC125205852 isoform X1 n=1 Tax=Salvia hispanica TaxID=49212 RepID=UPI0020096667|nr:uncharacterized protein LOC125205852 isoform X1 [Salvia hispanica]
MSLLMERDFFKYLPSEITTNILSRLPIRSLAVSKSVCKPWLNLIDSDEFHKSEIKTPPALALLTPKGRDATQCAIYEIEDEDEVDLQKSHDLHYISLTDFDIPHPNRGFMEATANGLLLLYPRSTTDMVKRCHVGLALSATHKNFRFFAAAASIAFTYRRGAFKHGIL